MAQPEFPLTELVEIEWWDTYVTGGWKTLLEFESIGHPRLMRSVGYVVSRDVVSITVLQTQVSLDVNDPSAPPHGRDSITIPLKIVKRVRRVR